MEFAARPGETYVIIGSANGMVLNPHTCNQGYLHTYKRMEDDFGNTKLELLHKVNKCKVQFQIAGIKRFLLNESERYGVLNES